MYPGSSMIHAMRVLGRYLAIGVLNELQYRANFLVQAFQTALSVMTALGGLAVIFQHTSTLGGWKPAELVALMGVYFIIRGAIYSMIQPSLQLFMEDVRKGTLDFALLKPVDSQVLISVRKFGIWQAADSIVGLVLIGWALHRMERSLEGVQVLTFLFLLGCGLIIVYSFWLLLATCSFWFVKVENILVIWDSLYQAGRWPVELYPPIFRMVLTFLVPVAFAVTVPAQALTGRITGSLVLGTLLLAILLFGVSRAFWMWGIRRYSGASA